MEQQFLDEINAYSISDLKLILETQEDLYSSEEFQAIRNFLSQKQDLQNRQKKLSGDWIFCITAFLIYVIGRIAVVITGFKLLEFVWLIFAIVVRWKQYHIGNRIVSTETFYCMISFLHPAVGIVISVWFLIKFPPLFKKCAAAAGISVLLQAFLMSGGFQI